MTYSDFLSLFPRFVQRIHDVNVVQMCGLSISSTPTKVKTVNEVVFHLLNQDMTFEVKDPIDMTACAQQAVNTFCYYIVTVYMDGVTVTITKGTDNVGALPVVPASNALIGAIKVTTDATHTFTSGTTALNATGITSEFFDVDVGIATTLLNHAMRGLERKHNFRGMKVRYSHSLSSGTLTAFNNPIPLYKQLIPKGGAYTIISGVRYPLNKQDIDAVEGAFLGTQTGIPKLIAEVPATETSLSPDAVPNLQWLVRPAPSVDCNIILTAYQYSPYLDGVIYTSNWWITNNSDILLYASLVEAEPYLKRDDRIATWKTLLTEKLNDLLMAEGEEEYPGSSKYGQGA